MLKKDFWLKNETLYDIYKNLIKSDFNIDTEKFFIDLISKGEIIEQGIEDPYKIYSKIIEIVENDYESDNLRIFFMNSLYKFISRKKQITWKKIKFQSYVKNYETEYRQKQAKENMHEVMQYAKDVFSEIPDAIEKIKILKNQKTEQEIDDFTDKNNIEIITDTGTEIKNSDTKTKNNKDDKSPETKNKSVEKLIFNLKPHNLTQMQTALFIYYLENSKHIKSIHVFAASENIRKLQAAEKRLKQFNLNKSADSFMHKYNKISNYRDERICLTQVKNIKRIIKLLDDFPEAKKLAEEELKSAEISKY